MSDFGSIILFNKKEGEFTTSDQSKIKEALKKVIANHEFPFNISEGNFSELIEWEDSDCCSVITAYYDGEDSEEIREFAEEEDVEDCKRIIKLLEADLSADFDMEVRFEDW